MDPGLAVLAEVVCFFGQSAIGKVGVSVFVLDALALMAIGIFPENAGHNHYYTSVTFFAFFPISMFLIAAALRRSAQTRMALFTLVIAAFAIAVWITQFSIKFVPGVAIPETLYALSVSTWSVFLGFKMLRGLSSSSEARAQQKKVNS